MSGNVRGRKVNRNDPTLQSLVRKIRQEVERRHGTDLTFEQRRDAAATIMSEALWLDEDYDLEESASDDDVLEIADEEYRRLPQRSSAMYFGRWGGHQVEESLYRKIGVHNGPTVKPIELRVGIVEHLTPDFARILGELSARCPSRTVVQILEAVGLLAPSRAFVEDRMTRMSLAVAENVEQLEATARESQAVPAAVASITCGMDRMAVRMAEPAEEGEVQRPLRAKPYERRPPPPKEFNARMAWVGSATVYDQHGRALHTWRHATDAAGDPEEIARRVTADVKRVMEEHPSIDVACVQDGACDLEVLPRCLRKELPAGTDVQELTDIKHTMGYLERVVDACEPDGDPKNWKVWYWSRLLHDDDAIDAIVTKLKRQARHFDDTMSEENEAIAAALSYIEKRTGKMRYATRHEANLTIGSGDTENTCWLMQNRVARPAQAWAPSGGLSGILALRSLVLSGLWLVACASFVASRRRAVRARP